jgi:hypothetical protein
MAFIVIPLLVGLVLVFAGRRRKSKTTEQQLLVSREDRTALFGRAPGRIRQKGLL